MGWSPTVEFSPSEATHLARSRLPDPLGVVLALLLHYCPVSRSGPDRKPTAPLPGSRLRRPGAALRASSSVGPDAKDRVLLVKAGDLLYVDRKRQNGT